MHLLRVQEACLPDFAFLNVVELGGLLLGLELVPVSGDPIASHLPGRHSQLALPEPRREGNGLTEDVF